MPCYVKKDCGNLVESLDKEQIMSAIAQATGQTTGSIDVDEAFITKFKEGNGGNSLKLWVGTYAQYNAIASKDDNTLYIIREQSSGRIVCGVFGVETVDTGTTYEYQG